MGGKQLCLHFPPAFNFSFFLTNPTDSFALRGGAEGCKSGTCCALPPFPPSLDSLCEHDWCKPFAQPQALQRHHMAGLDKTLWYFYSFIPNQLTVNPWHPSKGTRLFIQLSEKTQTHFDTVSANSPDNPKACQEDKPDVIQALSRATPDLDEGISSRNFQPLW